MLFDALVLVELVVPRSNVPVDGEPEVGGEEGSRDAVEAHHQALGKELDLGRVEEEEQVVLKVRGRAGDEEAGGADGDDAGPEVVAEALGADHGVDDQVIGVGLHGDVAGRGALGPGHDAAAGHGDAGGFAQSGRERRPEAGGGLGDEGRARAVVRAVARAGAARTVKAAEARAELIVGRWGARRSGPIVDEQERIEVEISKKKTRADDWLWAQTFDSRILELKSPQNNTTHPGGHRLFFQPTRKPRRLTLGDSALARRWKRMASTAAVGVRATARLPWARGAGRGELGSRHRVGGSQRPGPPKRRISSRTSTTAAPRAAVDGSAPTQDELPDFAKARRPLPNVRDVVKNPIKFASDLTDAIPKGADRVIDKKVRQVVVPANRLEDAMRALSGPELAAKTDEFRDRLEKGETLDDLLVEAFAVVRECARRELNMRHFDVQLVGGALLHDGCICEMATGEGKTLTATLPAYLNALTGKGVHVVTVNDYLARRDAEWMGRVHRSLGLTVGIIQTDMEAEERKEAYDADITYVTNTEVGFDYLRDNMANEAHELVMRRGFNFAIVDEVDSVLIDEGATRCSSRVPRRRATRR